MEKRREERRPAKCKNCSHWGKEKLFEEHMAEGIDARDCDLEPWDIGEMKNDE